jgi:GTP-binding protein HflX
MSDTVGFIDNLPHSLIASFRSTLSEVYDANLILKVIDASSDQFIKHLQTIDDALKELDINFSKSAQLLVLNKVDLINDENVLSGLKHKYPDAIFVSAFKELKINNLKDKISRIIRSNYIITEILIPFKDLKKLKEIYSELIIHKREDTYNGIKMKVEGDPSVIEKIKNK